MWAIAVFGTVLVLFPSLSFLVAARLCRIPTTLARAAGAGCVAAIASVAFQLVALWALREAQVGLSHRGLTTWMTVLWGTWVPATVAIWRLMTVRFVKAAGTAAVATVLYLLLCVGPYCALAWYWNS